MGLLCLLPFTQLGLFLKLKRSESKTAGRKQILTWNSHSTSFWVIHFAINHRPTRGSISLYNTAGLISEVSEEVATQIVKNCRRRQPHPYLTPRQIRCTNIRVHLTFPETRVIGLPLLSLLVWVYLHWNLCSGLQITHVFSATECVLAVQGHPRSMILVPIESPYSTSY